MRRRRSLNLAVERGDTLTQGGDQWHQNINHGNRGLDDRRIPDRRDSLADLLQALFDQLRLPAVVLGKKERRLAWRAFCRASRVGHRFNNAPTSAESTSSNQVGI